MYVKAGSILPMGKFIQYVGEKSDDTLEIRIYRGADGQFDLYEDEGDNYNYEKGEYMIIPFLWNEKNQTLSICGKEGSFKGFLIKRIFNIVFVNESTGPAEENHTVIKQVEYTGRHVEMKAK